MHNNQLCKWTMTYTFHHLSPQCHKSKVEIFLKSSVLVFQITLNSVSRDNLCWAPTFTWVGGKKLLLSAQKTAFCILHFIFCLLLFGFHILHFTFYIHHFTSFTRGHLWREKAGEERCERQWCTFLWRYQTGWNFGKIPNGLCPPCPHFRKIILIFFRKAFFKVL